MFGREKIHFVAPAPERVEQEMERFLQWFDGNEAQSGVIRSAIEHLWFVSIHPFEDGNGRLARILSDMLLARSENSTMRFYNITLKSWSTLGNCSKDTAVRDIHDLIVKRILVEDIPGAKRPSYSIVYDTEDLTQFFDNISITEENGGTYLSALFHGRTAVRERILKLDAERYHRGDLTLSNLLNKYCSYIIGSKT